MACRLRELRAPGRRPRGIRDLAMLVAAAVLIALAVPAIATAQTDEGGGINVDIDDGSTPTPTPPAEPGRGNQGGAGVPGSAANQSGVTGGGTAGGTAGGTGSGSAGGTGSGSAGGSAGGSAQQDLRQTPPGEQLALVVSGLTTRNRSSLNPFTGVLDVQLTVHNLSQETVEISTDFGVANLFGATIGTAHETETLAPGERRIVRTTIVGMVQSVVVNASATLTPPKVISGKDQQPVDRDTWVLMIPWAVVLLIAAVIVAILLVRRLRGAS